MKLVLQLTVWLLTLPCLVNATTITFEGFQDSDVVTSQLPGLAFTNTIILTSGVSLNELEFPPNSGANVASDNSGPIAITFASAQSSISGYFIYISGLTMSVYDGSSNLIGSVSSVHTNNTALSGDAGSSPNELLAFSGSGISRVVITGDPAGGSFTLDDLTYSSSSVPEPGLAVFIAGFCLFLVFRYLRAKNVKNPALGPKQINLVSCFSLAPLLVASLLSGQTIPVPSASPNPIPVARATPVTFTVAASDPSLIKAGVNLQRFDSAAKVWAVLSAMYDDGTHGDVTANDGVFTVIDTFTEPSPSPVVLRASAAFKGRLMRVFSSPFNLAVTGAEAPPEITIASPSNLSYFNSSPITVSGSVSDRGATVMVNGVSAPISGGRFTVSLPLLEGPNTITAVAQDQGANATAKVQVTLDTTPPRVTFDSPADGYITSDASVTATGKANDIVVGTVNNQQVHVSVNGVVAQVSNRSFQAANVPLSMGNNTVVVTGVDRAGNAGTASITVTRIAATQTHLRVVSGNNQSGPINSTLGQPLVVQLLDGTGAPMGSQTVVFAVRQNDGFLSGASIKSVLTNAQGQAQVTWTLGSRSGSANLVEANAAGVQGTATFTATGLAGTPSKIVVDAGGQQTGATGQPLANPLIVVVTDGAHNRLANVPVVFQIANGGGNFAGAPSLTTNTDGDGRALAVLTLGPVDGISNNLVTATFSGNSGLPASFILTGRAAGPAASTAIKGVVLDNSNNPVPNATIRAYLQNVPAQVTSGLPPVATAATDAQGQFLIQPAPVGFVKLLVDGSTIRRAGKWPNLEYELVTVSGQTNTVGQPIYLLPIDTQHQVCVSESVGGTVTLPQVPGFALAIQPGSATFPGGSKSGCVSVTSVHPDKIPMSPGFGQQPRFIVTIQPAGTLFNPPAQISLPNTDGLKPGQITEMYGFDHDLGMFVSIGTATCSPDGTTIKSDRGVGVVKAGWHCGGPPASKGGAGTCEYCQKCNGTRCVADPDKEKKPCTGGPLHWKAGKLKGRCVGENCNTCPDSVSLLDSNVHTIDPQNSFNLGARTIGGTVVRMQVSPKDVDFDENDNIQETLVPGPGTNCPASFPNACTGGGTFVIGIGTVLPTDGFHVTAQKGTFPDFHGSVLPENLLAGKNIQSCKQVCIQTYTCNGVPLGTFTITRSFSKSKIGTTDVTLVSITKK